MYIKALFESPKHQHQTTFENFKIAATYLVSETDFFKKNVQKFMSKK
jgi:hypothetical protein